MNPHHLPEFISRDQKEKHLNQRGRVIWITGLPASGKTSLACALENRLFEQGFLCRVLDGDQVRSGINSDLEYSEEERKENIRRIAEISKLFVRTGIIVIAAFISPTESMRSMAKEIIGEEDFFLVYLSTPLEVCEKRDKKGLYAKARAGIIPEFTGISAPFEVPVSPDLIADTTGCEVEEIVREILGKIL